MIYGVPSMTFFITTKPRDSLKCTLTAYSIYLEWEHIKWDNSSQGKITLTDKTELQSVSVSDPVLSVQMTSQHGHIQGVTGGMCETSGECSLGQTIPI